MRRFYQKVKSDIFWQIHYNAMNNYSCAKKWYAPSNRKRREGAWYFWRHCLPQATNALQKLRLRKAGLHLVGLVAKVITLIILRFNSKATYLSKIKILMRLRHHNFCAALLATVRASNSCACPAWLSIARSYAGRLVTYQVSLLYLLPRKEICGQISTRPLVALAVWGA